MTPQDPIQVDPSLRKANVAVGTTSHWYELNWLIPFRDLLLVAGGAVTCYGIYGVYPPLAWVSAGVGMMRLAWLMGKK